MRPPLGSPAGHERQRQRQADERYAPFAARRACRAGRDECAEPDRDAQLERDPVGEQRRSPPPNANHSARRALRARREAAADQHREQPVATVIASAASSAGPSSAPSAGASSEYAGR